MTKLESVPQVNRTEILRGILNTADVDSTRTLLATIQGAGWPADETNKVIGALGLAGTKPTDIKSIWSRYGRPIVTFGGSAALWGEMAIESSLKTGLIRTFLTEPSQILRNAEPLVGARLVDITNAFITSAGSIIKAPVDISNPILFNALGMAAAAVVVGGGLKKGLETFDPGKSFRSRSAIEREKMIQDGKWPVDKAGQILAFGATDTSLAEPLMTNLKKHGYVIPIHRGITNSYPHANPDNIWISAGADKSAKTTREMARRELLLRANAIDASVILVNCMREIGVYQNLDVSDTDNAPAGVMFPQVADAVFEQITELTRLVYGKDAPTKLYVAIISRYTTVGQKLISGEGKSVSITARELFEEETDEPTVIIEPEELAETELVNLLNKLKTDKRLFGEGTKTAVLAFGDSKTNEKTRENMKKAYIDKKITDEVVDSIQDANVVIMTSTEDIDMAALIQQYRQELDKAGKTSVPIIAILKRPDTRNLAKLGLDFTINVQELISNEVDKIFSEKLINSNIPPEVEKIASDRLQKRQKMRVRAAKT